MHRKLCCAAVKSLFTSEGKHGGEATVEAIQLIADLVKAHNCRLHPDSIEVDFLQVLVVNMFVIKLAYQLVMALLRFSMPLKLRTL